MRYPGAAAFMVALLMCSPDARAEAVTPSATPTAPAAASQEDTVFTNSARAFYADFVQGKVDRSRITTDLNDLMTDELVASISKSLRDSGDPKWTFVSLTQVAGGRVGEYRLTYATSSIYYRFGMSKGGTIFTVYFGPRQ